MNLRSAELVRMVLLNNQLGAPHIDPHEEWPVFVEKEPDAPDNCITVFRDVGLAGGRLMNTGRQLYDPAIKIRVRGSDYAPTEAKIEAIAEYLDQTSYREAVALTDPVTEVETNYTIHAFSRRSDVLSLGVDKSNNSCYVFTVNYTFTLE